MIRPLKLDVKQSLRSGVAVSSFAQCADELVLNAIDAKATCVAVRADLYQGKLQVVDNGEGISKEDMQMVGERYHTSKCSSLDDIENDLQHYGYRGEALASIRHMCFLLEIESRLKFRSETYTKLFRAGVAPDVRLCSVQRPSPGTTITIYDLFHTMPVRQKSLNLSLEFERVRQRLEAIALIHPKVSFSLRNDTTSGKVLQTHKSNSIIGAFSHLFGNNKARGLCEVKNVQSDFEVHGFIGKESHHNKSLQFIYINKRLVLKTKIHKHVSHLLSKTTTLRKKPVTSKKDGKSKSQSPREPMTPQRYSEKHGIFVLNISCPLSAYDITFDPAKTLVEFKNWENVLQCVGTAVDRFIDKESLRANLDPSMPCTSQESASDYVVISSSQESQPEETVYGQSIDTSDVTNSLQSRTVYRSKKMSSHTQKESVEQELICDANSCSVPQRHPEGNSKESERTAALAKSKEDCAPGQAIARSYEEELKRRSFCETAGVQGSSKVTAATPEQRQDGITSADSCSPMTSLYENTEAGGSSRPDSDALSGEVTMATEPQRDITLKHSGDFEDPLSSIPSSPSQLLQSRSQRKHKQHIKKLSQSSPVASKVRSSSNAISFHSPGFKNILSGKLSSLRSPVHRLKLKYARQAARKLSPLAVQSQKNSSLFQSEDPLSCLHNAAVDLCKNSARNSSVSISKFSVPNCPSMTQSEFQGPSNSFSREEQSQVLASLHRIRERVQSKRVSKQTHPGENMASTAGTVTSTTNSESEFKKDANVSKYKSSCRKPHSADHSNRSEKMSKFHELRRRLSGEDKTSSKLSSAEQNSTQQMISLCNAVLPSLNGGGKDCQKYSDNCEIKTTADKDNCFEAERPHLGILNPRGRLQYYDDGSAEAVSCLARGTRNCNGQSGTSPPVTAIDRKRQVTETPLERVSIAAKLARLSNSRLSNTPKVLPDIGVNSSENNSDYFEMPRLTAARSVAESGPLPLKQSCSYLSSGDFITTPDNFDFDAALKRFGRSKTNDIGDYDRGVGENGNDRSEIVGRKALSMDTQSQKSNITSDNWESDDSLFISKKPSNVPFLRVPSFQEMNEYHSESRNALFHEGQDKPPSGIEKLTEEKLVCQESPIDSIPITENESIENEPGCGSLDKNESVAACNAISRCPGETKPDQGVAPGDYSSLEYCVQYIPLSDIEGIEYSKDKSGCEINISSQLISRGEKVLHSSKSVAYASKSDSCKELSSFDSVTKDFPSSQGFVTSTEAEGTQSFEHVQETQEFNPHTCEFPNKLVSSELSLSEKESDENEANLSPEKQCEKCESNALAEEEKTQDLSGTLISTTVTLQSERSVESKGEPQMQEDAANPVGKGWVCKTDTRTGRKLYVNLATGNSSYAPPKMEESSVVSDVISGRNKVRFLTANAGPYLKGARVSTVSRYRDAGKLVDDRSNVNDLLHEHLVRQTEEELIKWRDAAESELGTAGSSIQQLFEDWENPSFCTREQDVLNAETSSKEKATQRIHTAVNPQTFSRDMLKSVKVLRQIDRKFIACTINTKTTDDIKGTDLLVVIDQHAAHERVRLEKLTEGVYEGKEKDNILPCRVTPPVLLPLGEEYLRVMVAYRSHFSKLGIEFTEEGRDAASIDTVPALFVERELTESKKYSDPGYLTTQLQLLIKEQVDVLQKTRGGSAGLPQTIHRILCSRACKGAIKFGDLMTVSECEQLISQLSECQLPFQCAHGRPALMPLVDLAAVRKLPPNQFDKPKLRKLKQKKI